MSRVRKGLNALVGRGRDQARVAAAKILFGGPKAFTGTFADRIRGLEPTLASAGGASILDIGCCDGLIAWEFARHGAVRIHGFDRDLAGVLLARRIFRDAAISTEFHAFDLARGAAAFAERFEDVLDERYDIVLFLGVYHHLARQMPEDDVAEIVRFFAAKASGWFVVRTDRLPELEHDVVELGFAPAHVIPAYGNVGMLTAFRRQGSVPKTGEPG